MDKAAIYFETSVVSYLVARPSRDIVVAAHQQLTSDWSDNQSHQYDFANAKLRSKIEKVCRDAGYEPPIICTPEELED